MSSKEAGREQTAAERIAGTKKLARLDLSRLHWETRVPFLRLDAMVRQERLRRGEITVHDLTPAQRRELVDPERPDLHALAAGPIMQPDQLYLPAGKISMAEARARESALGEAR